MYLYRIVNVLPSLDNVLPIGQTDVCLFYIKLQFFFPLKSAKKILMTEVTFLQLSPGWQKKYLKMHQIDALKYGILNVSYGGACTQTPLEG